MDGATCKQVCPHSSAAKDILPEVLAGEAVSTCILACTQTRLRRLQQHTELSMCARHLPMG